MGHWEIVSVCGEERLFAMYDLHSFHDVKGLISTDK